MDYSWLELFAQSLKEKARAFCCSPRRRLLLSSRVCRFFFRDYLKIGVLDLALLWLSTAIVGGRSLPF